ncbi:MAG: photosystem I reaction center subunit XI [Leptolyngbyaceae cyanobacterium RU_5_1]|nr:photosystem I reaction center subunit XI [Leptolyngbyaceae cyanobacterium RU_5_1]
MSVHTSSGSPVAYPQRYHTIMTTAISQAEQQDRWLKKSELNELANFFRSGARLLNIVETLSRNADEIVSTAANRIFVWGSPMSYVERPPNRVNLPGYNTWSWQKRVAASVSTTQLPQKFKYVEPGTGSVLVDPRNNWLEWLQFVAAKDLDPVPEKFHRINILTYGSRNMRKSMRDIGWFLRYVIYAIAAGDSSILTVNVRGLRGVIPEDVTAATVVAIQTLKWKSLSYFERDPEAQEIIKQHFDVLITEYQVESPTVRLRQGVSKDQQGLYLPDCYALSANSRPKFVIKPGMAPTEQQESIKAAYRQVFERDITRAYGLQLTDLESKVKSHEISVKEFIRQLGKSRVYRKEFYEPFTISRVVELAVRHFLGRGLYSIEEFQDYFEVITKGGLSALVDALVDSVEYGEYFGDETVPYLRGLGQEAQECRNWGVQFDLFNFSAPVQKVPQFITLFGNYQQPLPNQHPYGVGNDPLEIQFGAIFPRESSHPDQPAFFGKDHRRILISSGNGNGNGNGSSHGLGRVPGSLGTRSLKLSSTVNGNGTHAQGSSISLQRNSPEAVILGAYRQVFGREVYAGQRLTAAEVKLKSSEITMREFIRLLGKSRLFRKLYWEPLYITKAIEYIHRRLLGRPTYGREEMGRYYDLCAKQGFYALIDALIDSSEYSAVFGEDTVPYERYVTPRGLALRSHNGTGESWQNGFAGSTRRPADLIPSTAPAIQVSEGGQAWAWMMQVANQRRFKQPVERLLPPPASQVVAQLTQGMEPESRSSEESAPDSQGSHGTEPALSASGSAELATRPIPYPIDPRQL